MKTYGFLCRGCWILNIESADRCPVLMQLEFVPYPASEPSGDYF